MFNNEQTLVEQSRRGDHDAFGQLVRTHQQRLFHSVARILRCSTEAEDVVQEAFVRAYLKLGQFQGKSSFYTWLYCIARNLAATRLRESRRSISLEGSLSEFGQEPADPHASATRPVEVAEDCDSVNAALARLPDHFRHVLVLREIEGLDYESIADTLHLNVGTVRSRLHRARAKMGQICNHLELAGS